MKREVLKLGSCENKVIHGKSEFYTAAYKLIIDFEHNDVITIDNINIGFYDHLVFKNCHTLIMNHSTICAEIIEFSNISTVILANTTIEVASMENFDVHEAHFTMNSVTFSELPS